MKINVKPLRAAYAALFFASTYSIQSHSAMESFSIYFQADSFTHSETVPIKSALDDWEGNRFERGERQWTYNWLEAGIRYKYLSLGYLTRMDYDLRFSEDLAEIYWRTSNKLDFDANKSYSASLKINSFKADGIRFAYHNQYKFINYYIGISFLEAWEFYKGQITGDIQSVSAKDYDFDLTIDYHYTEDRLFDRRVDEPDGEGYSFDAGLKLQWKNHYFSADFKDIQGHLTWEDAPFTTGRANSNNNSVDENGFVVVNPTLSGFEGISSSYDQKLKTRSHFEYDYQINDRYRLGLIRKRQYGHAMNAVSFSYVQNSIIRLIYWPGAELIQGSWQKKRLKISAAINSLSKNEAETFWLSISWL